MPIAPPRYIRVPRRPQERLPQFPPQPPPPPPVYDTFVAARVRVAGGFKMFKRDGYTANDVLFYSPEVAAEHRWQDRRRPPPPRNLSARAAWPGTEHSIYRRAPIEPPRVNRCLRGELLRHRI